ncbi:hypothetical protein [Halorussus halobius]|uniref:hypothetical protein n=1 Tax=Halorussus halobius TaxID=1710537 RepID=UPI00143D8B12|nr:hypothetical protein [Halorussus halobius]
MESDVRVEGEAAGAWYERVDRSLASMVLGNVAVAVVVAGGPSFRYVMRKQQDMGEM